MAEVTGASAADELLAWLRGALPAGWMDAVEDGDLERFDAVRPQLDARAFVRSIGASGWAMPQWAPEHGGRGITDPGALAAIDEVKARYRIPSSFTIHGVGMAAPTILQWGPEDARTTFLPGIVQGEQWCQLFSEPGHGSDLAGLSTRAVRDGDEWLVNGQKVWTTGAHGAKWGMLPARTDPDKPKHKGITYFVCDMEADGVDVRPLRHIGGDVEFSEVFLSDVRIPDTWRVGPVGEGWAVTQTTLMNERFALSGAFGPGAGAAPPRRPAAATLGDPVTSMLATAAHRSDRVLQDRAVRLLSEARAMSWTVRRAAARPQTGGQPGPEGSVTKVLGTEHNQRVRSAFVDATGMAAVAWAADGPPEASIPARTFLRSRGNTIEGGTSEIQRNILGDRVLGLPREPDPSRQLPWREVPRS